MKRAAVLILLVLLSACTVIPTPGAGQPAAATNPGATPKVTETDCGCDVTGPKKPTPTGGLVPAGPGAAGPSAGTATPAALESLRDQWTTYTNSEYSFSFQYPAAYGSKEFGFCAARQAQTVPQGALLAVDLGSRTRLILTKAENTGDIQAAAEAFRADPALKDAQFDAPAERTVGGVPALTLGYRSGGTKRYAETTLFLKDGILYRLDTGTPSACDIPALDLTELNAYGRVLESFQFQQ